MDKIDFINKYIDENSKSFIKLSQDIWEFAELPYEEEKSASLLKEILREEGFEIEENVSGIPTAFVAKYGSGKTKFGFLGEYDALDNLSQEASSTVKKQAGPTRSGHGCGHNLLGVGALAASLACKKYIEENNIDAVVYYFGCPAEEDAGAKIFMARDGIFDDMDFVYTWHPSTSNAVQSTRNVAITSANFTFKGKSAHAGSSPWLGRSALDACELMSVGTNYLREHMREKERIHYAYLDAGGISANVVPDRAVVKYEVRSPKIGGLKDLFERVIKCAEGAALMTETDMDYEVTMVFLDYITNKYLGLIADQAFKKIGPPKWDESDYKLAKDFLSTYDDETILAAKEEIKDLYGEDRLDEKFQKPLDDKVHDFDPDDKTYSSGSTDVGNVSYACPTANISVATTCLGNVGHTWQMTAQSNSQIGHKGMITAAKVLALSALETLDRPEYIKKAKEFVKAQQEDGYKMLDLSSIQPPRKKEPGK